MGRTLWHGKLNLIRYVRKFASWTIVTIHISPVTFSWSEIRSKRKNRCPWPLSWILEPGRFSELDGPLTWHLRFEVHFQHLSISIRNPSFFLHLKYCRNLLLKFYFECFLISFDLFSWTKTFELLSFIVESFRPGPSLHPVPFGPSLTGKREFRFDFWEKNRIMQIIISNIIPQTVTKHEMSPSRQKCFFLIKQCLKSWKVMLHNLCIF